MYEPSTTGNTQEENIDEACAAGFHSWFSILLLQF